MWSVEGVSNWLGTLGEAYAAYAARRAFIGSGIAGDDLMDDFDLPELVEMGVTKKPHQKRILEAIDALKEQSGRQ